MFSVKILSSLLSKCSLKPTSLPRLKFSTMQQQPMVPGKMSVGVCESASKILQNRSSGLLQRIKAVPCYNFDTVRTKVRYHYFPRAMKRINKHCLEKRLSTRSQREMLFRKFIRGRRTLSTFDRFTNQLPPKTFRTSARINLFDRRIGYKKPNKNEYFRF